MMLDEEKMYKPRREENQNQMWKKYIFNFIIKLETIN
jgi:hypothetical protein